MTKKANLETLIGGTTLANIDPIALYYGMARGERYNRYKLNIVEIINEPGVYNLDVYEPNVDGELYITNSYKISFSETKVDLDGETLYAPDVLEKFSTEINMLVNQENLATLDTFKTDDDVIGLLKNPSTVVPADGDRYIATFDAIGAFAANQNEIAQWNAATTSWTFTAPAKGWVVFVGATPLTMKQYFFDGDDWRLFDKVKCMFSAANAFDFDYKSMAMGSSGGLYNVDGTINSVVATDLLTKAYSGLIDDKVLNTEYVYFPFVINPYPIKNVSDAATSLSAYYRGDCFALTTLPDATTPDADINEKDLNYNYNSYMCAVYGNHSKVANTDIGKDIWVSPMYHMARVVPFAIRQTSIAGALAGFDNAMCSDVKELRYYPLRGDMDNLYIARVNYINKFRNGTCVWQQLTSLMKDSSLTDIPTVNVALYIQRVVKTFCLNFIYFSNTPETHARISRSLGEFLKELKDNGWIQKFNLDVGTTEYLYKKKTAYVNIIVWPTKYIEKIIVTQYIR